MAIGQPINQRDVQNALGVSASVNKWSQLLTHANINMWSAFKPLYSSKITRLTNEERASGAHSISGYTMSWGIMKRISSSWSDFMDNYGNIISAPWIYDKPVIDGTCKLRISDYIGYEPNARRLVAVSFSSYDLWVPSAQNGSGYALWAMLTGLSTVSSENTGAMRWQELFGDHLDYYPTLIMTAGTRWQYSKSSDYRIRDLISRGDTGAQIYVDTATLASAIITDSNGSVTYGNYPINTGATWNLTMVLCSSKVTGDIGSSTHKIPDGANILRLEYSSGADRTTKTAKELKYKAFSSMKMKVTLQKESGYQYRYHLEKIELIAEKITDDAVTFNCDFALSAQVGSIYVAVSPAISGQSGTASNYLGTINFAASEIGTVTKTWQYNSTSGNAIPYTWYNITQTVVGSYERLATGRFYFTFRSGSITIGTFSGSWPTIDVSGQNWQYEEEFTLF